VASTFGSQNQKVMHRIIALLLIVVLPQIILAQKSPIVKGTVYDTLSKKGLPYATVSLVYAKDSTLYSFTRADSSGNFSFKQVPQGKYLLSSSYVGYTTIWKDVDIKDATEMNLGNVAMTDITSMSNVTVTAKRAPVVMNGDTVEFNTENFKTKPNAVVEDLLKKLPGVTVDADGTVRVNGQRINKVYVNGKEFFTGDPKMATKNLDADAIDKVQVFDKKSDKAEFTGIDDGNSQKAINLKLKKDRNKSLFGRATAGAGENGRYDAQANINKFNGDQQMSFIGMANNVNKQGFSIGDVFNFTGELSRGMRNGGSITIRTDNDEIGNGLPVAGISQTQPGVANTIAGGLNYNDSWNKKTDLNASMVATDMHLDAQQLITRDYLLPGNNYRYTSAVNSTTDTRQQRFNTTFEQKLDSFTSLKIVPSLAFQQRNSDSHNDYVSVNDANIKLNEGYNYNTSKSEGYLFNTSMLLRKRFKKKGRTISMQYDGRFNNSTQNSTLNTKNTFFDAAGLPSQDTILNQTAHTEGNTANNGLDVTYTEPIGKRSLFELSSFVNLSSGKSNKQTYDFDAASGKHDIQNALLSNDFTSNYTYYGGGINFRTNRANYNYTIGASLQQAQLKSVNNSSDYTIKQQFTDVLPNAAMEYKFSKYKNVRFNYNTSTTQPTTAQLQPLLNVSDPLNIVAGNPELKRSYTHNVSINYFAADPATQKNFFAFLTGGVVKDAIIYADEIQSNGARTTAPINVNGTGYAYGSVNWGFPIRKIKSRFEIGADINYNRNISFINQQQNNINNVSFNPKVAYSYSKDDVISVRLDAVVRINKATYSLQEQLNTNYLTQVYELELVNYAWWGLVLVNNFNYTVKTGRAEGFNTKVPFWNISLAKQFLKNKRAEIRFSVNDLLNRNTGISRTSNQNYIEDNRYNVLKRYCMVSFTYNLNKSGNKASGPQIKVRTFGN